LKITEGYIHGKPAYFIKLDHELIKPVIVGKDPIVVKEGVFTDDDGSERNGYRITINDMTGATDSVDGKAGSVPAPKAGEESKFLRGDGTWSFIEHPIDQELDPESANAVSNKAVCAGLSAVDGKINELDEHIQAIPLDEVHGIIDPETPEDPLDFDNEGV
jgi:hypothetical protein